MAGLCMSSRCRPWAGHLLGLALLAAVLLPLVCPGGGASAQAGPGTICIRPSSLTIGVGETATVEVWLDGGSDYYGLELRLSCDPSLVGIPSGQATPLWEVFDAGHHMIVKNEAGWCDDRSGEAWHGVWYAVANVNPAPAFSGSGRICGITLVGLAPGTATLHLARAEGGTDGGDRLVPAAADGIVYISLTPQHTPSPSTTCSPTPTATGSATPTPPPTPTATVSPTTPPTATLAAPGSAPREVPSTTPPGAMTVAPSAAPSATFSVTRSPTPLVPAQLEPEAAPSGGLASQLVALLGGAAIGAHLLGFVGGASLVAALLQLRRRRRGPGHTASS